MGRALLDAGTRDTGRAILVAAAAEFADLGDDPAVVTLGGQLARSHMQVQDDDAALAVCERVLQAAERADLVPVIADTLITKGTCLCNLRRYREGQGILRVGIAIAEEAGLGKVALRGLNNLIGVASELDPRGALEACRTALVTAHRMGVPTLEVGLVGSQLGAAYHTGDWAEALRSWDSVARDELLPTQRAQLVQSAAWILLSRGVDMSRDLADTRETLERLGDPVARSGILDMEALVAWCAGRLAEAREAALASNALATFPGMIVVAARCATWSHDLEDARADLALFDAAGAHGPAPTAFRQVMAAGVAALAGDTNDALRGYREGRAALRGLGLRWHEALAGLDMIETLPEPPGGAPRGRGGAIADGGAGRGSIPCPSRRRARRRRYALGWQVRPA